MEGNAEIFITVVQVWNTLMKTTIMMNRVICVPHLYVGSDIVGTEGRYYRVICVPHLYVGSDIVGTEGRYYRVIKKSVCAWWLQYGKLQVMFILSPASLQGQGDTRLTLTPSVIPASNYVIMVSDWNCLKYFCMFFVL
jgi:hypothetical protein